MKVAQLLTSSFGGAGIAATRIHNALRHSGIESTLFSPDLANADLGTIISRSKKDRLISKSLTIFQNTAIQESDDLLTPFSYSLLDNFLDDLDSYDVINIHAFYNLLSFRDLTRIHELGKPVIITLHDQRFFTGGCHYSRNCSGYLTDCNICPQARKVFSRIPGMVLKKNLTLAFNSNFPVFVTPSQWLRNMAANSSLISNSEIEVIPNPIPNKFFEVENASNFEKSKNSHFTIGFISENLTNPYKGLDFLLNLIHTNRNNPIFESIQFHIVGDRFPGIELPKNCFLVGKLDEHGIRSFLRRMDFLCVPSSQDNLPSVIPEALALGTPVLGSRIGGISEILENFQMPLFEAGNQNSFISALKQAQSANYSKKQIVSKSKSIFSEEIVSLAYKNLYKSLII